MKKEPIGWTHPLFLAILAIAIAMLILVIIYVPEADAQIDTTWRSPEGWGVANQKPASHIMDQYYDIKGQYGYGQGEVVWRGILDQGVWKQWTYIDAHGCDNYWGFWFDVPNKLYLLPRFQIEVEVETGERYYSDQYIISMGNGGVAYIVDYGDMQTHTIINDTYDGSHGYTLLMARFPWDSPPNRIVRYRFRGFMY
jgi:hypothetical protein